MSYYCFCDCIDGCLVFAITFCFGLVVVYVRLWFFRVILVLLVVCYVRVLVTGFWIALLYCFDFWALGVIVILSFALGMLAWFDYFWLFWVFWYFLICLLLVFVVFAVLITFWFWVGILLLCFCNYLVCDYCLFFWIWFCVDIMFCLGLCYGCFGNLFGLNLLVI